MQDLELSIIIPVKNVEHTIGGILRSVVHQISGLKTEFIVVDMDSSDRTILEAYQLSKELKIQGCVVRSGDSSLAVALNTGIQKAEGQYVSFFFLHRLYRDFLPEYLETARQGADVVFGCADSTGVKIADRRVLSSVVKQATGADFAGEWIRGNVPIEPAALLIRRTFLNQNQIHFQENVSCGFSEEFVFRCLLCAQMVLQSPTIPLEDPVFEVKNAELLPEGMLGMKGTRLGKEAFDLVDMMVRVHDFARVREKENGELHQLLRYQKLPDSVMTCVDMLLRQGMSHHTVKGFLKRGNYQRLLETKGKVTDLELKRRITLWKTMPWLYKPK